MADEIVNTLGFNVSEALDALARLDTALQAAGTAFGNFGAVLDGFNGRAAAALATMRGLASAASRLATSMQNMPAAGAAPGAAASPASQLWLPAGVAGEVARTKSALDAAGNAGQQAGQKTAKGMKDAANATNDTRKQGDRLIVSWNTIMRVVMTQTIVRAMSMIRDALKDAVSAAEEFQIRLAEIQTIAPRIGGDLSKGILGAGESLKTLQIETTEFAKSFNIPLPQVTEGLYQTLSNQFTSVTDRSNVMTAAMKLSKIGVMDFQQAILLLTGTLNAYAMGSEQADTVAAKFVETIRLGRIRGKELADTLGQVMPIASELGVSIDEVNAAIVSLTIGGLDAHKTVTALRAAMTAFLKPSEDMKKVMRGMGFSDPEQFISAFGGIQGAIKAISDTSKGSALEMAQSFRNVRAEIATFRLASEEGSEKYIQALKAMQAATPENLNKILEEFRSTDAERLTAQINALKVNLTQDFGQAIVGVLASIMEMMGGADKLAAAITALAAAAGVAAAALTLLAAGFALVHISLGPVGIAMLALTAGIMAGVGAYTYATMTNIANIRKEAQERRQATLDAIRDEDLKAAKWKETQEKLNQEKQSAWERDAAVIRRDYFKVLDELKVKNDEAVTSARNLMESMVTAQERVVSAYRNAANAAMKAVQESQQRQTSLVAEYADTRFKYAQKGLDAEVQADNFRARSLQLARQAAEQLAKAKSPDEIQAALAAFQRADAHAKEAESIASGTKNVALQEDAERAVLYIMQQKIAAEKELQQVQAAQADALAKKAAQEQGRVTEMKNLMAQILKDLQAFDSKGPKDPMKLQEQEDRLKTNLARFQELFMGGKKVDIADLLGMDQLQRRVTMALEGGVDQVKIDKFFTDQAGFADLRRQITEGIGPVEVFIKAAVKMDPALAEALEGMSAIEKFDFLGRTLGSSRQVATDFEAAQQEAARSQSELSKFAANARQSLGKWGETTAEMDIGMDALQLPLNTDWAKQLRKVVRDFRAQAAKFTTPGAQVTDDDFKALEAAYKKYAEFIQPSAETTEAYEQFVTDAKAVLQQSQKTKAAADIVGETKMKAIEAAQRIPDIEAALKAAKEEANRAKQSTDGAYQGAQMTGTALGEVAQMNMSGLTTQIGNAANAMWDLAMASWSVESPAFSGETARFGGPMRRFASGGPVGTDVIPAMLSPGEFVMNAASSRRFAAQLSAMNAGVRPVFHSEGGTVTNIGDINVTVTGGGSSNRQTGRSIAAEIRRELRRGTSTL